MEIIKNGIMEDKTFYNDCIGKEYVCWSCKSILKFEKTDINYVEENKETLYADGELLYIDISTIKCPVCNNNILINKKFSEFKDCWRIIRISNNELKAESNNDKVRKKSGRNDCWNPSASSCNECKHICSGTGIVINGKELISSLKK